MDVKVSICIPTFNQIQLLSKNLESIVAQSFTNYEIIITDDSTNTDVEFYVREFFSKKNINYTYHKNPVALGSPANWNKAVSFAKGEYIKILHHDDWFSDKESLATFVNELDKHPESNLAFCNSSILNIANNSYSENRPDVLFLNELRNDAYTLFNNNRIGSPSAVIYRAKFAPVFDEKLSYLVDVDFYIQVLKINASFVFIDKALIVNTSNNPAQVTAASLNKKIQIGEYCYLYNKIFTHQFPDKKIRVFFKNLFKNYKLSSLQEIEEMGFAKPKPNWLFKILVIQSKLSSNG